jgi:hypothetical protein
LSGQAEVVVAAECGEGCMSAREVDLSREEALRARRLRGSSLGVATRLCATSLATRLAVMQPYWAPASRRPQSNNERQPRHARCGCEWERERHLCPVRVQSWCERTRGHWRVCWCVTHSASYPGRRRTRALEPRHTLTPPRSLSRHDEVENLARHKNDFLQLLALC